jgi:antitoxin component YwqK of YwqJK toxin-antitoxin module
MRKQTLLLPVIVYLSCAAYGQTREVEKQSYLKGSVQSLHIETGSLVALIGAGLDSRPRVGSRERQTDYLYDEGGNLLETLRYSRGGVAQREIFKYDDKGKLVEEARYEPKDVLVERITHSYNADGRRNESLQYDGKSKLIGKVVYQYDPAGKLIEEVSTRDDKPNGRAVFAYDSEGRASGFMAYDGKGDIPNQVVNSYDDKANRIQKSRYGLKGNLEGRTVTTYDSKGNVILIDHFRGDGSPAWKWEFEYDHQSNVIKEKFSNKDSLSVWLYAYEYDSTGNWTRKTKSQLFDDRGKLTPHLAGVTFRTFKYYSKTNATRTLANPDEGGIVKDAVLAMAASEIRPIRSGAALAHSNPHESLGKPVTSGTLKVEMTIDTEGNVESARVVSGAEVLNRDVRDVEARVKKGTYKPVLLNGVPVRVTDTMTLKYEVPKLGRGKW